MKWYHVGPKYKMKILCNKCSNFIRNCNFVKHHNLCDGHWPKIKETFVASLGNICIYCGAESKNNRAHSNHERTCPKNLNRKYVPTGMKGKTSPYKGKTKETSDSLRKMSETLRRKYANGEIIPHRTQHTRDCKERMSLIMKEKMKNRRTASKRVEYNGVVLESLWEYNLAVNLDSNKISWTRPEPLLYKDDTGQIRRYYPDFYIPHLDLYLDPKNDYLRELDKRKIDLVVKQNNVTILILNEKQLSWDYIQEFLER